MVGSEGGDVGRVVHVKYAPPLTFSVSTYKKNVMHGKYDLFLVSLEKAFIMSMAWPSTNRTFSFMHDMLFPSVSVVMGTFMHFSHSRQ